MIDRAIIPFFAVFLTSRFFTEILGWLPKAVDLLNFPFIVALTAATIMRPIRKELRTQAYVVVVRSVVVFSLATCLSLYVHMNEVSFPVAALFTLGFLEGPLLFVAMARGAQDPRGLAERVQRFFIFFLMANAAAVCFVSLPSFLRSANPDVMSGTYGLNAYQFSVLLLLGAGLLLGQGIVRKHSAGLLIACQIPIVFVFVLLQYRSGLPFYVAAYAFMLVALYGRQVVTAVLGSALIVLLAVISVQQVLSSTEGEADLKYGDWITLVDDPFSVLAYGKFLAYPRTGRLILEEPWAPIVGVGPGNFLSRANYTFTCELLADQQNGRGVGLLVRKWFGAESMHVTQAREKYLADVNTGAAFGSYQLSNPNSSYLSVVAEVGLIGGGAMIFLYGYMVRRAVFLARIAKKAEPRFIPLALASVAGSTYLLGLGFLDNWWEMSRATLPVWLIFWATEAGIACTIRDAYAAESEAEVLSGRSEEIRSVAS